MPTGPDPERLAELSELDVRTVMPMIRDEFTVDDHGSVNNDGMPAIFEQFEENSS